MTKTAMKIKKEKKPVKPKKTKNASAAKKETVKTLRKKTVKTVKIEKTKEKVKTLKKKEKTKKTKDISSAETKKVPLKVSKKKTEKTTKTKKLKKPKISTEKKKEEKTPKKEKKPIKTKKKPSTKKTTKKKTSKKEEVKEIKMVPPPPKKDDETEERKKIRSEINKILKDRFLPRHIIDSITERVEKDKTLKSKVNKIVEKVIVEYTKNLIDPTEACGMVGAQSIGEPGTQMSLPYDEVVLVMIDDLIKPVLIGEFVDGVMKQSPHPQGKFEIADVSGVKVLSLNENERLIWKKLKSCSRHENHDDLLKLRLRSGREIIATPSHSFVIREDNKVVSIEGRQLQVGQRIPSIKNLPIGDTFSSLTLREYFPPSEYWYGSELALAQNGNEATVPVGSDQLRHHLLGQTSIELEDGLVYPFQPHGHGLPETLKLNREFGWWIGAYLAEGNSTKYYTSISNVDDIFLQRGRDFARKFGLSYNEYDNPRGFALGHDLRINSSILSDFMKQACCSGADAKMVPEFAYTADENFVSGLLRGYFDGDGNISIDRKVIRASSSSKKLIDAIALLLSRFGIFSRKGKSGNSYTLSISHRYAPLFEEKIGLDNKNKQAKLKKLAQACSDRSYDVTEMYTGFGDIFSVLAKKLGMPSREVRNFTQRQRIGRTALWRYIQKFEELALKQDIDIEKDLANLRKMAESDVIWDEIIQISWVKPNGKYLYDFSVDGLDTFSTFDGVLTHNTMRTFHYAGVAEINVTLGLPRLIEIVDARSIPSTPMMTIYLQDEYKTNPDLAKEIANKIEITRLTDVADIEMDLINIVINIKPNKKTMEKKGLTIDEMLEGVQSVRKTDAKIEKKDTIKITLDEPGYMKLQNVNEALKKLKIKGIDGIKRVIIRNEPDEGYVIYSEGSNLTEVLKIEGVDPYRTATNDIHAVARELGIEAARNMIIQEAHNTLSEQGLNVDLRHIMLVADTMTADGTVRAIGRHGVSGEKSSVLSRAAFEITVNHLLLASQRGESDTLNGVAENIIVGQPVNLGTGAVKLVMELGKTKKKKGK
jgi:DNA-directed RNA polymerase subunit A"